MFESPMSHFFRHALLAYKAEGKSLAKRIEVNRQLNTLETACSDFISKNGTNPRVDALLEKVKAMKQNI